jgi:hypothetical protein
MQGFKADRPTKEPPLVLNFDDIEVKRRVIQKITLLKGLWEFDLKPRRFVRTPLQNRYYWIGVVIPFREWLREAYGDSWITAEQAHEMLKARLLPSRDGEIGDLPPSTTQLSTAEFAKYVDDAAAFLAEFCGVVVIPPEIFYQQQSGEKQ